MPSWVSAVPAVGSNLLEEAWGGHNQINALVGGSRPRSYRLSPPWVVWQGEPDECIPARERLEGNEEPRCFGTIRASLSGIPTARWNVTVGMSVCLTLKANILAFICYLSFHAYFR
jgi:hypothetical protein